MKKFILLIFIIFILSVSFAAAVKDVPINHWAYDSVRTLVSLGIMGTNPDGTFKGSQTISRYDLAYHIYKTIGYLDDKIADLDKRIKTGNSSPEDISNMKAAITQLNSRLSAAESLISRNTGVKGNDDYQKQINDLKSKYTELVDSYELITYSVSKVKELEAKVNDLLNPKSATGQPSVNTDKMNKILEQYDNLIQNLSDNTLALKSMDSRISKLESSTGQPVSTDTSNSNDTGFKKDIESLKNSLSLLTGDIEKIKNANPAMVDLKDYKSRLDSLEYNLRILGDYITEIKNNINTKYSGISKDDLALKADKNDLNTLSKKLDNVSSQTGTEIQTLKDSLEKANNSVNVLSTKLDASVKNFDEVNTSIKAMSNLTKDSTISALDILNYAKQIKNLDTKFDNTTKSLALLSNDVNKRFDETDNKIALMYDQIKSIRTSTNSDNLRTMIDQKANKSDIQNFDSKINDLNSSIDKLNMANSESLKNKADKSDLDKKSDKTDLDKKVDKTEFDKKINELSSQKQVVQSHETALNWNDILVSGIVSSLITAIGMIILLSINK